MILLLYFFNSMQFDSESQEKRPKSMQRISKSKKVSFIERPLNPSVQNSDNDNQQWQKKAAEINKKLKLNRMLYQNRVPFQTLTKYGNNSYKNNSLPNLLLLANKQQIDEKANNMNKRISYQRPKSQHIAKGKLNRQQSRIVKTSQRGRTLQIKTQDQCVSKMSQKMQTTSTKTFHLQQKSYNNTKQQNAKAQHSKIKLLKKKFMKIDTGFLPPQLPKNEKNFIGYNMQFEQKFGYKHLKNIKVVKGKFSTATSIIHCLKDQNFIPNIMGQKNQYGHPISICLFPQFFDGSVEVSETKKAQYLEKMVTHMNNTYDPEIMSKMPIISTFQPFNSCNYKKLIPSFYVAIEKDFQTQWAEGIIQKIKMPLQEQDIRKTFHQLWEEYNIGNAMSRIDYALKNPSFVTQYQTGPYLNNIITSSKRIIYHGGYSKHLYKSWRKYIEHGRKVLQKKIVKCNPINQAINSWFQNFCDFSLIQTQFLNFLGHPIKLGLFEKIQLAHIQQSLSILRQYWLRGVLLILHKRRFLCKSAHIQNEYAFLHQIKNKRKQLKKQLIKSRIETYGIKNNQELQNFYFTFFQNYLKSLHKAKNIKSLEQLLVVQDFKFSNPPTSNIQCLLNIQLTQIIQKSYQNLKSILTNPPQTPIIRLTLIVDRQTLQLKQKKQDIQRIFKDILNQLFKVNFKYNNLNINFEGSNPQSELLIKQYPQIGLIHEQKGDLFHLNYKYSFVHTNQLIWLSTLIDRYYTECFSIIQYFSPFMPFIKLTAFSQFLQQNKAQDNEQSLIKNLNQIKQYKTQLTKLKKHYKTTFFEVDCENPLIHIQNRIKQVEYLVYQTYLNGLYDRIQAIQQKMVDIRNQIYSYRVTALNYDIISGQLKQHDKALRGMETKVMQLSKKIYFYLQTQSLKQTKQSKPNTLVGRLQHIVFTRKQIAKLIIETQKNMKNDRIIIQDELKKKTLQMSKMSEQVIKKIESLQNTTYLQLQQFPKFFKTTKNLANQIQQTVEKINNHYLELTKMGITNSAPHILESFFLKKQKFQQIVEFWSNICRFQEYFKNIQNIKVVDIRYEQFATIMHNSMQLIGKFQNIQVTDQKHIKIFKKDLSKYREYSSCIEIATNNNITLRHWQIFKGRLLELTKDITIGTTTDCNLPKHPLSNLNDLLFKNLLKIKISQQQLSILREVNQIANIQFCISQSLQKMIKNIKQQKIQIIDVKGSDAIEIQSVQEVIQQLADNVIECNQLLQKKGSSYFAKDIIQFKDKAVKTHSIMEKWLKFEKQFIRFTKFYRENQEIPNQDLFDEIKQLHRKLIKSFDSDNSLWFVSQNIVLPSMTQQIVLKIDELNLKTKQYLQSIRRAYPRLFILSDEQLFSAMSERQSIEIQKNIQKCFPSIKKINIKDGAIQGVGQRQKLKFTQLIYLEERLTSIQYWMKELQTIIVKLMKNKFDKLILSYSEQAIIQTSQENLLQLQILHQNILFTNIISIALSNDTFAQIDQYIKKKIQQAIKLSKDSEILLLYISQRQVIQNLSKKMINSVNNFQWLKYPRFYIGTMTSAQSNPSANISISILNQSYKYGFCFIQQCSLIINSHLFFGNCLVGPPKSGKKTIISHYAYVTGYELFTFHQLSKNTAMNAAQIAEKISNMFKAALYLGSWLLIDHIQEIGFGQLSILAEFLLQHQRILQTQNSSIKILNQSIQINKNSKIFLTFNEESYHKIALPQRLLYYLRPNSIVKPDTGFLTDLYLQAKGIRDKKIINALDLAFWVEYGQDIPIEITGYILKKSPGYSLDHACLMKQIEQKSILKQTGKSILKSLQNSQITEINSVNNVKALQQILFQDSAGGGYLVYGKLLSGKRLAIRQITDKYNYLQINLAMFTQFNVENNLKSLISFIIAKKYKFLIIINGIEYFRIFEVVYQHGVKVIYKENNIDTLHGPVVYDLKLIRFQNENVIENILGELYPAFKLNHEQIYHKILQKQSFLDHSQYSINQIKQAQFTFLTLYTAFVKKFTLKIAFAFAFIWAFKSVIPEQTIIENINFQELGVEKSKLSGCCLQQLIPETTTFTFKNEKAMNIYQANLVLPHQVYIYNNIFYNLELIRSLTSSAILIESSRWLTTLLKCSTQSQQHKKYLLFSKCLKYSNDKKNQNKHLAFISYMQRELIQDQLLTSQARKKLNYDFQNYTYIMIDDIHLSNDYQLKIIEQIACNKTILYPSNKAEIRHLQFSNCNFTLGTKIPCLLNNLGFIKLRIGESIIETIYSEFVTNYWSNEKTIQNACQFMPFLWGISRFTQIYWVSIPTILCLTKQQKPNLPKTTDSKYQFQSYYYQVLSKFLQQLPKSQIIALQKQININSQFDKTLGLNLINTMTKDQDDEEQTLRYQKQQEQKYMQDLIQAYIQDYSNIKYNSSETKPKQQMKFIITDYLKSKVVKTMTSIINYDTVIISQQSSQKQLILQLATQILKVRTFQYENSKFSSLIKINKQNSNQDTNIEAILVIDTCNKSIEQLEEALDMLQQIIRHRKLPPLLDNLSENLILKKTRYIVKMDAKAKNTQSLYQKYPFLKQRMAHIYLPTICRQTEIMELYKDRYIPSVDLSLLSIYSQQILRQNDQGGGIDEKVCYQIFNQFCKKMQIDNNFVNNFLFQFQLEKHAQFSKFQFYRNVVEDMVNHIDYLSEQLTQIPGILKKISPILGFHQNKRIKLQQLKQKKIDNLDADTSTRQQLLKQIEICEEQRKQIRAKITLGYNSNIQRFEKLEKKIDSFTLSQLAKLKKNNDNVCKIINEVLALFFEEKINSNNVLSLKNYRKRNIAIEDLSSSMKQSQTVIYVQNLNLQVFKAKCQQIKSIGLKKIEKLGNLQKAISEWILHFQQSLPAITYLKQLSEIERQKTQYINQLYQKHIMVEQNIQKIKEEIKIVEKQLQEVRIKEHQMLLKKKQLIMRQSKLETILQLQSNYNYIKEMSSQLAAYFCQLFQSIFLKAMRNLSCNQFLEYPIFTKKFTQLTQSKINLFASQDNYDQFKCKYNLQQKIKKISTAYTGICKDLYYIFNNGKMVTILQDSEMLVTKILNQLARELGYFFIDELNIPGNMIQKLIFNHSKTKDRLLIFYNGNGGINGGWNSLEATIQKFIRYVIQRGEANKKKIIIVCKKINKIQIESFWELNINRVVVDQKNFYSRITKVLNSKKVNIIQIQQQYEQCARSYSKIMKEMARQIDEIRKLDQRIDTDMQPKKIFINQNQSFYAQLQNNFKEANAKKQQLNKLQSKLQTHKQQYISSRDKLSKIHGLYIFLKKMEGNWQIQLFDNSDTVLDNVVKLISQAKTQLQTEKDQQNPNSQAFIQKFTEVILNNSICNINWLNEKSAIAYCYVVYVLKQVPFHALIVNSSLSLLFQAFFMKVRDKQPNSLTWKNQIISKISQCQGFEFVNFEFLKQFEKNLSGKTRKQQTFSIPKWLELLLQYCFLNINELTKKPYSSLALATLNSMQTEKKINLKKFQSLKGYSLNRQDKFMIVLQSFWSRITTLIHEIKIRAFSEGCQFQIFYFKHEQAIQYEESLNDLKKMSERKVWVYLANINNGKEQEVILNRIVYEISRMPRNNNFKIFVATSSQIVIYYREVHHRIKRNIQQQLAQQLQIFLREDTKKQLYTYFNKKYNKIIKMITTLFLDEFSHKQYTKIYFLSFIQDLLECIKNKKILPQENAIQFTLSYILEYFQHMQLDFDHLYEMLERQQSLVPVKSGFTNKLQRQILFKKFNIEDSSVKQKTLMTIVNKLILDIQSEDRLKTNPDMIEMLSSIYQSNLLESNFIYLNKSKHFCIILYRILYQYLRSNSIQIDRQQIRLIPKNKKSQLRLEQALIFMHRNEQYQYNFDVVIFQAAMPKVSVKSMLSNSNLKSSLSGFNSTIKDYSRNIIDRKTIDKIFKYYRGGISLLNQTQVCQVVFSMI